MNPKVQPKRRQTREERRQETQAALRESALREFALHSVAGTSAERIAEAAGFTRGAFYASYKNKQDLLLDLIRRRVEEEQEAWTELADGPLDFDTLLARLQERSERYDPSGLWTTIWAETHLCAVRDPEFRQAYCQYHDLILERYVHILQRLFDRAGKLPPEPLQEVAEALLALARAPLLPGQGVAPRVVRAEVFYRLLHSLIDTAAPVPLQNGRRR